ncbi:MULTISPECIES: hypothetical protein [unclassified Bradyrhizobium]|uniref:hypothetical protein n=1 Tax=unclassified Bradyrhizobium TaxID=2631580 RepID=UPI00093E7FB6|nr:MULTISPECIES: hypothetical protein [unclassified Bradyrhizobium]OKO73160.1 hypothetical protein AC629_36960 [Bradyrhizobium sp. NAS80.1]OKO80500.1 hypothetical protein AC630_15605 [Bradyrhizobium sp. AS23.2]
MQQEHRIFDSEELSTLGEIFDRAITALPAAMRTPENRTAIAHIVLQRGAARGAELASLIILMDAFTSAV